MNISSLQLTGRRLANPLLTIVSLVFALLAVEIGLRLFWIPWDLRSTPGVATEPIYGFAPLPGVEGVHITPEYSIHFRHSRQGWRGEREFARERPVGISRRILLLGDSFTYGYGSNNDETFAALLQETWPEAEVANTGCNGYGTRNELAVLDHFGAAFHPDLAAIFFFWNDLPDNLKRETPAFGLDSEGHVVRRDCDPPHNDPLAIRETATLPKARSRKFYLEHLLSDGLKVWRYRFFGMKPPYAQTRDEIERAWTVTGELLRLASLRAREFGAQLAVVCIPDHNQIDPQAKIAGIEPIHFEIQDRLNDVCEKFQIPYLDLLPAMKERWEQTHASYYYYADRHLTPEGNRLVAELVRPAMESWLK